jgi:hypothetical protein
MKFIPNLPLDAQVDYSDGFWTLSLPYVDAAGRGKDFYEAEKMLEDNLHFLWNEYVLCPEEDLGETGKMLRALLLELFAVS